MTKYYFGNKHSNIILIQMVGEHELPGLEREAHLIMELADTEDFCLMAYKVDDWNDELSPWKAPAAFGDEEFAGNAERTLSAFLDGVEEDDLKGRDRSEIKIYLGGYSLAGLFALWAAYKTDLFDGVAAVSPSVWFPEFYEFVQKNDIMTSSVYLSLGDKESKTRNPVMAQVGDKIQMIYDELEPKVDAVLEWNEGNHFREPDLRMAKGFAWVLKK